MYLLAVIQYPGVPDQRSPCCRLTLLRSAGWRLEIFGAGASPTSRILDALIGWIGGIGVAWLNSTVGALEGIRNFWAQSPLKRKPPCGPWSAVRAGRRERTRDAVAQSESSGSVGPGRGAAVSDLTFFDGVRLKSCLHFPINFDARGLRRCRRTKDYHSLPRTSLHDSFRTLLRN
ncbi:hypothetical protein B0H66DRAFT_215148 [Apodospora peruviana]|uniref:Uncharacterized protein n=1 Tax=Apodospora peruviana TaxID=516989 RepID=A0AAE0ICX4_9PEZI|nr:hypothetical protein B0H66DRAFT_215148 [Apodospora peruviana]